MRLADLRNHIVLPSSSQLGLRVAPRGGGGREAGEVDERVRQLNINGYNWKEMFKT
jgi:hypothetical protein